jgi:hypothetical protein
MTDSHKGSLISQVNRIIPIDNNTTALFHYDITTNDVLNGISPISDVSTVLPIYGKFGGGVSVEEGTTNLAINGDLNPYYTTSQGWDVSLNGNLYASSWSTGYNSGVTSANVGYHAHLNVSKFGYPVLEYIDMNSQFGSTLKHRWLGISQQITTNVSGNFGWGDGTQVTYSFDMMVDGTDKGINMGLYHTNPTGSSTFGSTQITVYNTKPFEWQRKYITTTLKASEWDFTKACSIYIYGHYCKNDYEGIAWVKNVQVETKGFPTSFVETIRPSGILKYPSDCINPSQGTISFWYKPNYPTSSVTGQTNSPKLIQIGDYYTNSSITIWNFTNNLNLFVKGATNTGWSLSKSFGSLLQQDTWSFITVSWSGTTWKVYKDGILLGTNTANESLGKIGGNSMYVGGDGGDGGSSAGKACNGIIDELRIDNIARTDEEIQSWYIANQPFYPKGIYRLAY